LLGVEPEENLGRRTFKGMPRGWTADGWRINCRSELVSR
jgi:hypothetical protein